MEGTVIEVDLFGDGSGLILCGTGEGGGIGNADVGDGIAKEVAKDWVF